MGQKDMSVRRGNEIEGREKTHDLFIRPAVDIFETDEGITLLADLPPGCDPCGENGEFHTVVVAGPMFSAPIDVALGEIIRGERFHHQRASLA